jgi:hypothetical protein
MPNNQMTKEGFLFDLPRCFIALPTNPGIGTRDKADDNLSGDRRDLAGLRSISRKSFP